MRLLVGGSPCTYWSIAQTKNRERYGWAANPWVWVIEFEKCKKPEEG